ncbi:DUF998 domain-containing protein [Fructilactobacillus cliffordii]|uniref:DUF998 domain-containing protein n=1 Tax=Fructilactobacillus cliffordii TaxID=2940299 RepID=A0A9Q9E2S7_9LACO|nr:DUF998 domain-containing protein [Fructilactobacillus cliffordii]USS87163.1 DUF998 domain-containing protein [Fructilactobacillus cliffordii]USS88883.1 DUF998 domain-containing protein [Fructilactobacillus cliffordii]
MKSPKYYFEIPEQTVQKLKLQGGEKFNLQVDKNGLQLEKENVQRASFWNVSYWWDIIPAILMALVFFTYCTLTQSRLIPLTGDYSIATGTIILGTVMGSILFTIFFIKTRNNSVNSVYRNIYWRNLPTIIIAVALILLVSLLGIFWIFSRVFYGAEFDHYTATMMLFMFGIIINTIMINIADNITPTILVDLLILMIIGGLLISMLANGNKQWWKHNISFLGTAKAIDSWQFNLTFIVSALLMLALVDYLFVSLKPLHWPPFRTFCLRLLLTLLAVDALAVGLIYNDRQVPWMHYWHDQFAWAMALVIIILIGGIKWLLPNIPRSFMINSYLIVFLIILVSVLFRHVHYLSLTAFEILASALGFSWIMMLFQYLLGEINQKSQQVVRLQIKKPNE